MADRRWLTLNLIPPVLAVAMVFAVPALRATAPLTRPVQWTVAELATTTVRAATRGSPGSSPDLRRWLDEARTLWRQFHGSSPSSQRGMAWALAAAALIPVLAIVAGLCALLSLIFQLWARRLWLRGAAIAGVFSSAYVIGASCWLTHMVRSGLAEVIAAFQHRWGGLIAALDGNTLTSALSTPLGLLPQAGLYVLLLAFVAILLLPEKQAIS